MNSLFNKVSRTVLAAVVVSAGAFAAVSARAQDLPPLPKDLKDKGELRVGVKCDSPPFGMLDTAGKPIGIEVEMAKRIAEYAFGSADKANLVCVTSEARIPSLQGGKIDLILATLGKFPERQKVIDFTEYYFWGESNVLVPKASSAQKLADLKGKNVLIVKGGSQATWFEKNIPEIQLTRLNTTGDSIQALLQGRGDGFVGDGMLVATLAVNYPDLRIIGEGLDQGFNGIGVRKGETELTAYLDAALRKLRAEGFYGKVVKNFVSDPAVQALTLKGFEPKP